MYDSVTTWRLYSAEQSVSLGEDLADLNAARALVRRVRRSAWWRDNVAANPGVRVSLGGSEDPGEWVSSFAYPSQSAVGRWNISLHPTMLNDVIVLHELAHCIAPRFVYSGRRRRRNEIHNHAKAPVHGSGFAGAMAELVREFGSGAVHDELREAYQHFGVPVMTLEEYRGAVSGSLLAEVDDKDMREETQALYDSLPPREPPSGGWRVPTFTWGDVFMYQRVSPRQRGGGLGLSRRIGRDRLADQISQVVRCTRRDIEKIEEASGVPDDQRLRRVAMCFAVLMNFDPIYMRHVLGLVRWDCGVELDELRVLNADWVALVEDMNAKLEARPPRWVVDGER